MNTLPPVQTRTDRSGADSDIASAGSWIKYAAFGLLIIVVAVIGILAGVPPVSRDALTHHLVVPKLYLQQGGIYEIPDIAFSYYPMNLDLLYMIPLYFGNDIVPKFIHFSFAVLTAAVIFAYLRNRLGILYGIFGALFFLSLPVIVKLSVTVYVDLGLTFFSFAALVALIRWRRSGFRLHCLLLAGVACGLALGTKYNGLLTLFILTLITPVLYIRSDAGPGAQKQWKAAAGAMIFACIALAVFSPWMIRNALWTGNPIYPLYKGVFTSFHQALEETERQTLEESEQEVAGSEDAEALSQKRSAWNHIATRRLIYGESWWQIALLPVRIFFQGEDDNPKYFDGKLNPFLFLLPLAAFALGRGRGAEFRLENRILMAFVVMYIAIAFASYGIRIRYISPIIPPLVILSAFGFRYLLEAGRAVSGTRTALLIGVGVLTLALAMNAVYIAKQFRVIAPMDYLSGRVDRDAYITRYRPEYTVLQYANEHLGPDVKILAMFIGNRRYYSDRPMVIHNFALRRHAAASRSTVEIATKLRGGGITHLVVGFDLFNRWGVQDLEDNKKQLLSRFFKNHTRLLKAGGGYGLFELVHSSD